MYLGESLQGLETLGEVIGHILFTYPGADCACGSV